MHFTGLAFPGDYGRQVTPGPFVIGKRMGSIVAPRSTRDPGVEPEMTGIASAMINTYQQVGASVESLSSRCSSCLRGGCQR
jgi:hypothetical protein